MATSTLLKVRRMLTEDTGLRTFSVPRYDRDNEALFMVEVRPNNYPPKCPDIVGHNADIRKIDMAVQDWPLYIVEARHTRVTMGFCQACLDMPAGKHCLVHTCADCGHKHYDVNDCI